MQTSLFNQATATLIYINLMEDIYLLLKYTLQIINQEFVKYDIYVCAYKQQLYYMTRNYMQRKIYICLKEIQEYVSETTIVYRKKHNLINIYHYAKENVERNILQRLKEY